MIKTFTVAGLATDKHGNTKVRYANNLDKRIGTLKRDGFTNINFIHSETPKTKIQLCNEMLGLIQYQNDKAIIEQEIKDVTKRLKTISRRASLLGNMTAEQLLEILK